MVGVRNGDTVVKKQVKCKFCKQYISEKTRQCVDCMILVRIGTSELSGICHCEDVSRR